VRQTAFSTEIIILHLFMKTNRRISRLFLAAIFAAVPFASWVHANPTSQNYPFSNPETARSAQVAEPRVAQPPTRPAQAATAQARAAAPAAAPAAQATRAAPSGDAVVFDGPLFRVTKELLSGGQVGSEFVYRIRVDAKENIANIRIHEELPSNVRFVRASPSPTEQSGQDIRWAYDRQAAGSSRNFDVTIIPTQEGRFETCTIVTADPILCLPMFAGSPLLAITKTGPSTLEVGEVGEFELTVRNTGTAPARNVTITDQPPSGLSARGSLTDNVGTLNPGDSHSFLVRLRADQTGEFINTAVARADGLDAVQDTHPVAVIRPGISIEKTGPERQFVFTPARYDIVVRNTGDVALTDVVVTDTIPERAELIDRGGAEVRGRNLTWTIPNLGVGQERSFSIAYTANAPLTLTNVVAVETARGLRDDDRATTVFVAPPGIKSVLFDDADPVRVGDIVTYIVEITNQGQFESVTVAPRMSLSDELAYVDTRSPSRVSVDGNNLTFEEITIAPRRSIRIEVRARAVRAGVGRATLNYQPAHLDSPITEQESTFIF
jgi:uncharacterized repeat protein (TIGR01451 family)